MAYTAIPAASSGGSGAPTDATYVTQTSNGTLSAEQALSALSSGPMYVTTTTGVITALTTLTGLTSTSSALTNNLITGLAGGQTIIGGTASGESLTHSSTSHATKGTHIFGTTSGMVYDEANVLLRVGTATTFAGQIATLVKTVAGDLNLWLANTGTGTSARAVFQAGQTAAGTGAGMLLGVLGTNYTTAGVQVAGAGIIEHSGSSTVMIYNNRGNAGCDHVFTTTASVTERFRIANDGSLTWPVTGKVGAFGATAVAQQTVGANVNNVAASGTTGQFDDFTNGTTYATDYAALHATVYQLTRSVAQLTVAVRALGFAT